MGKAKALRLGIVKGIKHNAEKIVDKSAALVSRPYVNRMIGKLKCTVCGHSSNSHSRRRPPFEGWDARKLLDAIESTGSKGSGGFMECSFYFCDDCKVDVLTLAIPERPGKFMGTDPLEGCPCVHEER
jgi:hypothetical protein